MSCLQCGTCCDPILLRSTKKAIRQDQSLEGDEFVLAHWHRMSQREAFAKRPMLRQTHYSGRCYYTCDRFDALTRRCGAHDLRPPICHAFPNHLRIEGRRLQLRAFPDCGYNGT